MRGADATKSAGTLGAYPTVSQQFVVLVAPGLARILRAVPLARGRDDGVRGGKHPHERSPERTQAPFQASSWVEAVEGLRPGLHYLH